MFGMVGKATLGSDTFGIAGIDTVGIDGTHPLTFDCKLENTPAPLVGLELDESNRKRK